MNFTLTTTVWILMLAVGYLFTVYSFLWWAKRNGSASKRTLF